jgi:hypothetical protein
MRDPDLVFRAQVAASALERAWQRWRDVHGPAADSAPTVSSYVGYSLEEPWGEPRVVFGLPAEDAEQLVMLLDRHDCVGPVHALLAGHGALQAAGQGQRLPVRVPAQSSGSPEYDADDEPVSGQDEPVFRQVAAAAQEASAAYVAAAAHVAGQEGPGQGDPILSFAVRAAHAGHGEAAEADDDVNGYDGDRLPEDGTGPLSLAASAAQAEAEVRIRASLRGGRPAVEFEYPYAAGDLDVTGSLPAVDDGQAVYGRPHRGDPGSDDAYGEGRYASGDDAHGGEQDAVGAFRPRTDDYSEDDQDPQAQDVRDQDLPDDDLQDQVLPDDGPHGHPRQGVARHNRISRGSMPRRTKRQGTVSGT